ncbi:MAG TPA: HAD family hydrolase [Candidatus Saccharimonadales bacterium]|nr:HAD family hydrolase [Candidatus Saccharimonadales bacterium]
MDWTENLISLIKEKKIRGVIFDFDGTLHLLSVDWDGLKKELIEKYDLKNSFRIKEMLNQIKEKFGDKELQTANKIVLQYEKAKIHESQIDKNLLQMIEHLAEMNVKLAICSNNMTETITTFLQKHDINSYFDIVIGKDMVQEYKPDPEGLKRILTEWAYEKDEVIFVGDTEVDNQTAKNCGIQFLLIQL